jgi:uncharacterized protein YjbI with pentapeptide repeats
MYDSDGRGKERRDGSRAHSHASSLTDGGDETGFAGRIGAVRRFSYRFLLLLYRANLLGRRLVFQTYLTLRKDRLAGADLSFLDLREYNLSRANLHEATLIRADLGGTNLRESNLLGADLSGANLAGSNLAGARLTGATVTQAQLSSVESLEGATMPDGLAYSSELTPGDMAEASTWLLPGAEAVDLRGHDLRWQDLQGARWAGAILRGANLRGANLTGANLRGADLFAATLDEANLAGADLRGADLIAASLRDTDLREANLKGALATDRQLARTRSLVSAVLPDGRLHY